MKTNNIIKLAATAGGLAAAYFILLPILKNMLSGTAQTNSGY